MSEFINEVVKKGCEAWGVDTDGSDYEHHHVARAAVEACAREVEAAGCICLALVSGEEFEREFPGPGFICKAVVDLDLAAENAVNPARSPLPHRPGLQAPRACVMSAPIVRCTAPGCDRSMVCRTEPPVIIPSRAKTVLWRHCLTPEKCDFAYTAGVAPASDVRGQGGEG